MSDVQVVVDLLRQVPNKVFFFGINESGDEIAWILNYLMVVLFLGILSWSLIGLKALYQYIFKKGEFSPGEVAKKEATGQHSNPLLIMFLLLILPLCILYWGYFTPHNKHNQSVTFEPGGMNIRNNVVYAQSLNFNSFVGFNDIVDFKVEANKVAVKNRGNVDVCVLYFYTHNQNVVTLELRNDRMHEINLIPCI